MSLFRKQISSIIQPADTRAATIGNWIGGAAGVGLFVACVYGAPGDRLWPAWERCVARTQASLLRCTQAGRRISVGHVHE